MALSLDLSDRERLSRNLNGLIDGALEAWNAKQKPRTYLGGSRLGVECLRALGFEWQRQQQGAPIAFPGRVIRRFQMGHIHESETAKWLRLAGFELLTQGVDGEQFGFKTAVDAGGVPRIAGHLDGVITSGPMELPYPVLWEHKIMNNKSWSDFMKRGLEASKPVYWGQVHVYMGYMELGACLFTALNTDTSEIGAELVPLDLQVAQRMSDRGVRVIEAARPEDLPRITNDPSDFKCKWCDHRDRCWGAPERVVPTPTQDKPAWLGGAS